MSLKKSRANIGRTRRMSVLKRVAAIAAAATLVGTVLSWRPLAASAANMIAINPANGGSATTYTVTYPGDARCGTPSNVGGGDQLDSFVVDNAKVPESQIGSLTFTGSPPFPTDAAGYIGGPIISSGNPYELVPTLPATGQPPALALASWQGYVGDFGTGMDLHPGIFNVGVACVTPSGHIDGSGFWNVQIAFTASSTDPGGFTWALAPFATSVALAASPQGHSVPGASVTLTATLTPATAPGTITFYNGSTALGTNPVVVNSGVATSTLVTGSLPSGTHSLTALYTPTQYNSTSLQATDVYASSRSPALSYTVGTTSGSTSTTSTTSASATTTTVPGGTTTTTATASGGSGSSGQGSGTGSSGTGSSGTGSSGTGSSGTGSSGFGSSATGSSAAGGSDPSSSAGSDPTLAATGPSIGPELLVALLSILAGLFVLSFGFATMKRERRV
jgi:hypothetical protein